MLLSLFILLLASALPTIILNQTQVKYASAVSSPVFPTAELLGFLPAEPNRSQKKKIWRPSRTLKNPTQVNKIHNLPRRSEGRSAKGHTRRVDQNKQTRIFLALIDCLSGIQQRVRNIRVIASERIDSQNAQKLAWSLLRELHAINTLFQDCLARIKTVNQPIPSSKPSSSPPTLFDICRLMAEILTELRLAIQITQNLSRRLPIIENICGDTLSQLSTGIADIIIASSGQLTNVIKFIASIFASAPGFFKGLGFGFEDIPDILADSGSDGLHELDQFI